MKHVNKLSFLGIGDTKFNDFSNWYVDFISKVQLKDRYLWKRFVEAYRTRTDYTDLSWKGEFFGKMMRGACLTYHYTKDEELYAVLKDAVEDMLTTQDEDGRFSTYPKDKEYDGWDIWCRKYVMTSLLHFYDISKDEDLKERIVSALCRHADYMVATLGNKEGQHPITHTSNFWGSLNSCSILEPFVNLYNVTKKQKYLDFAEYIVSTGGCEYGNLIELAYKNKLAPYQYPVTKAYEMMSFFEGVLAYYQATGNKRHLIAVKNFINKVIETDLTIIGCSGCTHELFDNSSKMQTEPHTDIMQETCVAVTWTRLLTKMMLFDGDVDYMDYIEQSILNTIYGSVNTKMIKNYKEVKGTDPNNVLLDPLPFDSYSPLLNESRGQRCGGLRFYDDGFFYGCCACIGAAGIALCPLTSILKSSEGVIISSYLNGEVNSLINCEQLHIKIESSFVTNGKVKIHLLSDFNQKIELRIPGYIDEYRITLNGHEHTFLLEKVEKNDVIEIEFKFDLIKHELNNKIAFTYGPSVLAVDQNKSPELKDLSQTFHINSENYKVLKPLEGENVRLDIDGILFTDYASCGKNWLDEHANISVWIFNDK